MQRILLFGELREVCGTQELQLPPVSSVALLRENLCEKWPALSTKVFSIAVNKTIVTDNTSLSGIEEVALLPPFSGG